MAFFKKLIFWRRRDVVVEHKGRIEELKKQVEEIAARQKHSEAKFICRYRRMQREGRSHIMELQKKVQRQNIVIKKLEASLGAVEVEMKERNSEREELKATPALKNLKEIRPELEEVEVMEQENTLLEGPYARCHGSYMRWEHSTNDSRRSRQVEKAINEEKAELRREIKEFVTEYLDWNARKKRLKRNRKRARKKTH